MISGELHSSVPLIRHPYGVKLGPRIPRRPALCHFCAACALIVSLRSFHPSRKLHTLNGGHRRINLSLRNRSYGSVRGFVTRKRVYKVAQ